MMQYHMPTQIFWGNEVIRLNQGIFKSLGNKALIVTGRNSAKVNGSLDDVIEVLKLNNIQYRVYDQVLENPTVENIEEGVKIYPGADFVIGIGGGSPLDAAKAIAICIPYPKLTAREVFWSGEKRKAIPFVAIPTTAGTGSETTPYAVLTETREQNKKNFNQSVFPVYTLVDTRYYLYMPLPVRKNTAIDALSHLIESYLSTKHNCLNNYFCEEGFRQFAKSKDRLSDEVISIQDMDRFIHVSLLAGMAISQTGTSLPHGMGYPLTYFHGLVHGRANGVLLRAYMEICKDTSKVSHILELLNFTDLNAFGEYIYKMIGGLNLSEAEMEQYSNLLSSNELKLKNHPDVVTYDDILSIYKKSLR